MAIFLALVILAGSLYALLGGTKRSVASAPETGTAEGYDIFELGQVRASSADLHPAVIAVRISFPYPASSVPLKEELQRKAPALKAIAITYLSGKKAEELHPAFEGAVKAGLRDAFNGLLSLGSLKEIWLTDFAVVQ